MMRRTVSISTVLLCLCFWQTLRAQTLSVRDIMAEPSIAGMRPEGAKISPDGRWCAFLWSAAGRDPRDLYLVPTDGKSPARLLVRAADVSRPTPRDGGQQERNVQSRGQTHEQREELAMQQDGAQQARTGRNEQTRGQRTEREGQTRQMSISAVEWSPDSRRLLFSHNGDLYVVAVNGGAPRRLTQTSAPEVGARWLADGRRIIYQSSGNIFVLGVDEPQLIQLTRIAPPRADAPPTTTITNAVVSDDGARVAYVLADTSQQRALIVPDYTGEFVTAPTVRRGWTEQRIEIIPTDGSGERPMLVKLPPPEGKSYVRVLRWLNDGSALIVDRIDRDTRRRQLFLVSAMDGAAKLLDEETDEKWIAPLSRIVEPSPRGDQLLFASERDGFNHLYLLPIGRDASPKSRQLTRGPWEVSWATWLPDGANIIYSSTEDSTAERHFYLLDVRTGTKRRLPTPKGMNTDAQLSKNGERLLFEHSEWNSPNDLYALQPCTECDDRNRPVRLTDTVPARFRQIRWTEPRFVTFPTKDGKTVRARLYLPRNFDRAQRHPAVIFIHGAGYLQNVINGWNNYYREAMFHHLLAERGYLVFDIDYRGSAGYGRDWRTDVHGFLGGLDLQDHLDGIDYLVREYNADPTRIGVYGGSYGGFMAEMLAMRAPERVACAAALRPVADWRNYYASSPVYTTERLGFPDENPEAYRRSSPISYADQLRRPLLILHGMLDDNVHFQDSVQLVQKLIELGKTSYFEVMFYPKENHSFTRPESWADEYERILAFFEKHLEGRKDGR
ncbi:S9 family peptidase [Pyrinomonas sp.]|uniref:S9 family peptidase n=1 Tax=Pyrinomonas sp. TaxID=2080306 RepID=UPI00332A41A0